MNFPNQPIEVRLTFDLTKITPASCTVPLLAFETQDPDLRGRTLFRIMGCPFRVIAASSFPERVDGSPMGILGRDARAIAEQWFRMTAEDRQADMARFRDSNPTLHAAAVAIYNSVAQTFRFPGEEVVSAVLLRDSESGIETARGVTIGDVVTLRGLRQAGINVMATCGGNSIPQRCVQAEQMSWSNDRTGRAVVRGLQHDWPRDGVLSVAHFGGRQELVVGDYPGIGAVFNYVTTEMEYSSSDNAGTATLFLSRQRESAFADQILPQEMRTAQAPPLEAQAGAQRRAQQAFVANQLSVSPLADEWARNYAHNFQNALGAVPPGLYLGETTGAAVPGRLPRPPSPDMSEANRRFAERVLGRPAVTEEQEAPRRHAEIGRTAGRGVFIAHE